MSTQLNSEKENVSSLNEEISSLKNLKNGFEEQIKLLEERIKVEEDRNYYSNVCLGTSFFYHNNYLIYSNDYY